MLKENNSFIQFILISFVGLLLAACNSVPERDPAFAPIRPAIQAQQYTVTGAIYQVGYDVRLFEDIKARRIGDILTVKLVENTDASKSSDTAINKTNSTDITNPTILGTTASVDLPGFFPLNSTSNLGLGTSLSSSSAFSGDSATSQENSLSGEISVSVVEVFPNGNMLIRGEKRLTLNNGNEYIRVSGIIRPTDVQANNTVLSTQLADATIMYTGEGQTHEPNIMGWLARFFISAIMPF